MKKNYIFPHNIVINLNGADAILLNASEGNPAGDLPGFDPNLGGNGGTGNGVDMSRDNSSLWDNEW